MRCSSSTVVVLAVPAPAEALQRVGRATSPYALVTADPLAALADYGHFNNRPLPGMTTGKSVSTMKSAFKREPTR
jgi:hypothetical protein